MKKFVRLTAPDGKPVWIMPTWVTMIKIVPTGEYVGHSRTLVTMGGSSQAVTEAPEDVVKMLEADE